MLATSSPMQSRDVAPPLAGTSAAETVAELAEAWQAQIAAEATLDALDVHVIGRNAANAAEAEWAGEMNRIERAILSAPIASPADGVAVLDVLARRLDDLDSAEAGALANLRRFLAGTPPMAGHHGKSARVRAALAELRAAVTDAEPALTRWHVEGTAAIPLGAEDNETGRSFVVIASTPKAPAPAFEGAGVYEVELVRPDGRRIRPILFVESSPRKPGFLRMKHYWGGKPHGHWKRFPAADVRIVRRVSEA
ncbi:hypothetical protein [Oharaeibacter diazotrophicus]|uniref:Uncharacterized protein n=1 Tax=Oharaeibacter diazotrophicus TaxID=1920512 RepID=A0A4R6RGY1_9HYPH|nr:hypothetical protein [Oharaeibacter diazotrophicus]TDP85590.1 hypothetical protein EDD54_2445 [Oharaeibacter diazotrophicus]BBE74561.1 hypothetical protein OHA_1_04193 [Pleomorphomonas sp. SM30]GLS75740.1 hypothetical protein GCM10007904_10750 [Oharaeibacter diazotrophicus]